LGILGGDVVPTNLAERSRHLIIEIAPNRFLSSRERQSQIEKEMQMKRTILLPAMAALLALTVTSVSRVSAQDRPFDSGSAPAPNEVAPGTRFLIRLDNELGSKDSKAGRPFTAHTIEPLASANGTTLPAGAEIRGHIDKVEAAGKTGRARLWLTFDDIRTPDGWMPLIAVVDDLPGVHSIRVDYDREGEIEVISSKRWVRPPAWRLTTKKTQRWERLWRRPRLIWSHRASARN
jgi:hypothetical protein